MKTADQLLSNLQELGLFSEDAIGETKRRWQQSGVRPDAVAAAKELVKSGRLTRYQAEEILNGRGTRLSFGAYVILDKLGQGGMGMVLRGQHREMKRPVAIKMLPKEMLKNLEASQRFKREAEAAGRLLHPNIVTAYDSGTIDGTPYLVMELVAGSDLHSFVSDHGPMRVLDAIHCITEVARGLEYAHDQGIVHRDIKPANLLLATGSASGTTKAGAAAVAALAETAKAPDVLKCRVKVLDMGLARIDEAALAQATNAPAKPGASPLTGTGDIMGTVDYMSPEQAVDTRSADARADVYSLGCTLCYLLTGHPPFSGETMVQRLIAHRTQPIVSLRTERPDVPESLDRLYQHMLAKHPDERIGSMTEVIAALEDCRLEVSPDAQKAAMIRKPAAADQATRMGKAGSIETLRSRKARTQRDDEDLIDEESPEGDNQKTVVRRRTTRQAPQTVIVQSSGQWIWLTMGIAGMLLIGGMGYAILQLLNREPQDKIVIVEKENKSDSDRAEVVQAPLLNSERSIAEWALSNGGRLRIFPQKGEPQDVFDRGGLPATPFRIDVLAVDGASSVTDAEMSSMNRLKSMSEFSAARTGITDAGLRSLVGLSTLKSVNLRGVALTDSGLETIGKIPQLSFVSADGNFTDDGIAQLKQLEQLEHLALSADVASNSAITTIVAHHPALVTFLTEHFNVTDDGLNPLLNLSELRVLGLADAPLTDASMETLSQMKQLTTLIVQGTKITPDGLRRLQEALPACRIYGGKFDPRRNAVREILEAGGKVTIAAIGQPPFELTNFAQLPDDFSALSINLAGVKTINLSSMALNDVTDLNLAESGVLSRDIARLSTYFPILTSIDLTSTSINDTTCLPLQLVKSLRFCDMSRTQVTNTSGNKLKQANPDCAFKWGIPERSPDREVANLILAQGSSVNVVGTDGVEKRVVDPKELPSDEFKVRSLVLNSIDPQLASLIGKLHSIEGLYSSNDVVFHDDTFLLAANAPSIHSFNSAWSGEHQLSDIVLRKIGQHRRVTNIHFINASFTDAGILGIGRHPEMQLLVLQSNTGVRSNFTEATAKAIVDQFPNLRHLSMGNWAKESDKSEIVRTLAQLRSLECLDSIELITDETIQLLEGHPRLKNLNLGGAWIHQSAAADVAMTSVAQIQNLRDLNLENLPVTDKGIEELLKLEHIESIGIGGTKATHRSVRMLRERFPNIVVRGAGRHWAAEATIRAGGRLLITEQSGRRRWLEKVEGIPSEDFEVTELDLRQSTSAPGLLGWALRDIQKLNLSGPTTIAGVDIRSVAWSVFHRLEHLDLSNAKDCLDVHIQGLAQCKTLKVLILKGTHVTAAGIQQLSQQLPGCRIEWDGGSIGP